MTQASPGRAPVQRFVLRASSPVRALAVAAVSAVGGAGLLVLWRAVGLSLVLAVLGAILLAFALALLVAALVARARLEQTVELNAVQITRRAGGRTAASRWADIKQVRLEGARLQLLSEAGQPPVLEVLNPGGSSEQTFLALLKATQERLDADRGYRTLDDA